MKLEREVGYLGMFNNGPHVVITQTAVMSNALPLVLPYFCVPSNFGHL